MNKTSIGFQKDVRDIFSEYFPGYEIKRDVDLLIPLSNHIINDDFSIRGKAEGVDLLYLVNVKYFHRKVETDLIDEFSEKIKTVSAQKGFFICADGFCGSMEAYALQKGIELVSISDIINGRWKPKIEIPVVYIQFRQKYFFNILYRTALLLKMIQNYRVIKLDQEDLNILCFEKENTPVKVTDLITQEIENGAIRYCENTSISFTKKITFLKYPLLEFDPADVELQVQLYRNLYLHYLLPEEFRKLKRELSDSIDKTRINVSRPAEQLDDSYISIDELPVKPLGFAGADKVSVAG